MFWRHELFEISIIVCGPELQGGEEDRLAGWRFSHQMHFEV